MGERRYPWDPAERLAVVHLLGAGRPTGVNTLGELFGVHGRQISRRRDSGVTRDQAELAAVVLGMHVYEIWPDALDDDIAALPVCAAVDCDDRFAPRSRMHRYCTTRCRRRQARRDRTPRSRTMCAADGCTTWFTPVVTRGPRAQIYCSRRCNQAMAQRRYRTTERGKQANRRAVAKWRADVAAMQARRAQRTVERQAA